MTTLKQALGSFAQEIHNPSKRRTWKSVKVTDETAKKLADLKHLGISLAEMVETATAVAHQELCEPIIETLKSTSDL